MKRRLGAVMLGAILAVSFGAACFPRYSYEEQHRDMPGAGPSVRFPLGTDDLGRDRMARLLYATRISLVLAGAAALGSTALALVSGGTAGYAGGWWDNCLVRVIDLVLSLPWLFLVLAVRALLPLNAPPVTSLGITYALLALLGWAAPARVIRAGVHHLRESDFVLQAKAAGCPQARLLFRHILPNLMPVLIAQFCTSIPVFILAEANLGFLGLSASDPLPTWGNLLRELQNPIGIRPECFVPVAVIAASVLCFKFIVPVEGSRI